MRKIVKLNANQLRGLILSEARSAARSQGTRKVKITESYLRRIIREEMESAESSLNTNASDGKNNYEKMKQGLEMLRKLQAELSDEEMDQIFAKIKNEARRVRGRRL